ncbi:molybdopterin-dependent oxidoreductase [uncultured Amnibacterium sp.]|uniref:molybdopterin-dependent oxidoreductase n=1 Tax=uncultured Amnibacterium sp. TaxID=1631851 RepID=UPI0035CC0862
MRRLLGTARLSLASPARHPRTAVVIGRLLGVAFLTCFATGLYSHLIQNPLPGEAFLTRPVWIYRVSQGLHVTTGIACIPLLLGKLYTIFPLLFKWPPVKTIGSLLERASIALFVSSSLVQLAIGLVNTYQWYPWHFGFRQVHYALSYVIIASLAIHIAVKLPVIQRWWTKQASVDAQGELLPVGDGEGESARPVPADERPRGVTGLLMRLIDTPPKPSPKVSRRTVLGAVGVTTAAAVVLTAGQTVPALDAVNVFAPRKQRYGPQSLPVNKTARSAGVIDAARSPDWRLSVRGPSGTLRFTLDELRGMPQTSVTLPISCVEGWSTNADWRGVRFSHLASLVGGSGREFVVRSIQKGAYSVSMLQPAFVRDPLTLVALELNGQILDIDHGYPARLIAPARPGVLQTKWLRSLEAR